MNLKEEYVSSRFKRASQSSRQESEGLSASPGTDLVPTSDDLLERIVAESRGMIAEQQRQNEEKKYQEKIDKHYARLAERTMKKLWRECKRRTGHNYTKDDSLSYNGIDDNRPKVCSSCGHPTGYNASWRAERGFARIGQELRAADKKAGVEWIPDA